MTFQETVVAQVAAVLTKNKNGYLVYFQAGKMRLSAAPADARRVSAMLLKEYDSKVSFKRVDNEFVYEFTQ